MDIILLALLSKYLGFKCLFFIPMLLNPTYSFIVCSISIVIISVQYLQSRSTTVSVTAVNSIS